MARVQFKLGADISEAEKAFKRLNRKMQKFGRQCEKTGKVLTKTISLPLVAVGTAAFKAANDVDKANKTIARGTGATGKQLQSLQKDWKSLAGQVSQSFEQSSQVLADYNTRLGLTGKALKGISKQALDAGRMMGEDVNSVVSESAKLMQDWSVEAGDMTLTMDKIFQASQSAGIGMGKLSTQMYKYGSALRGMGFDLDNAIALLASFEKEGVNSEAILGALRQGLGRMAREGITDASEAFKTLIERVKNAETVTEGTRLAIEIFGSRAGPDLALAIREGRLEVDDLVKTLQGASGAIERNSNETKTLGDRWGETKNQIMLALEPMGEVMLKMANDYVPALQEKIEGLSSKIALMSDEGRANILKLAAVLAGGSALLVGISAVITAFGTLSSTIIALATGPAAPLIALGAAVAIICTQFEGSKEAAKKFNEQLDKMDVDKLKELQGAGIGGALGLGGTSWKDSVAIAKAAEEETAEIRRQIAEREKMINELMGKDISIPGNTAIPSPGSPSSPGSVPSPGSGTGSGSGSGGGYSPPSDSFDIGSMYNFGLDSLTNNLPEINDWFTKISEQVEYMGMPLEDAVLKLEGMKESMVPLSDEWKKATDMVDQYKNQLDDVGEKTDEALTKGDLWANDLARGLAQAVVSGRNLSDTLQNIGKQLASSALQEMFALLLGGGKSKGKGITGFLQVVLGMHEGGTVGQDSSFARRIPRMHSGGLVGSNEQLTILEKGETVIPKGSPATVVMNILDEGDLERKTLEVMAKYPGANIIKNHVIRDSEERGPVVSAFMRG